MSGNKKVRFIEREDDVDEHGSWAVSYGDMITLLLSFFVIYFTTDPGAIKEAHMQESLMGQMERMNLDAKKDAKDTMGKAAGTGGPGAIDGGGPDKTAPGALDIEGLGRKEGYKAGGDDDTKIGSDEGEGHGPTNLTNQGYGPENETRKGFGPSNEIRDGMGPSEETNKGLGASEDAGKGMGPEDADKLGKGPLDKEGLGIADGAEGADQGQMAGDLTLEKGKAKRTDMRFHEPDMKDEELKNFEQYTARFHKIGRSIMVEFPSASFFELGKVNPREKSFIRLERFAKYYMPYAGKYMLNIRAFTDSNPVKVNKNRYKDNLELSALRSISTMRVLQKYGIPLSRMQLAGHGVNKVIEKKLKERIQEYTKSEKDALARTIILLIKPEEELEGSK